jgi:NAD+ synthase
MKIYVAQTKPRIGDLTYNFNLIEEHYSASLKEGCDVCMFPELATTGYIPADLLLKPAFLEETAKRIEDLVGKIKDTVLLLPTPINTSQGLENAVIAIQNGKVIGQTAKRYAPNYGIFEEKRYFSSGNPQVISINGVKVGVPICEDIWFPDVTKELKAAGAEVFLIPNGSPFEKEKLDVRLALIKQRFEETNIPMIYCNQVLGHDGIVYDGNSFGFDGKLSFQLKAFVEDVAIVTFKEKKLLSSSPTIFNSPENLLYGAMVLGLRDYIRDNNFDSVLLGLSGGIDSALVAAIAVDSLGANKVQTIMMPTKHTSQESIDDAEETAKLLGVKHTIMDISNMVRTASDLMPNMSSLAYENLQARVRGMILMSISNSSGSLVLTTGNKSEYATGYATLYGDMCGAFNPIKDLYKSEVFKMARFRNNFVPDAIAVHNPVCPVMAEPILHKSPSAELRENQRDSDSLPEYDVLDQILELYIEKDYDIKKIVSLGFDSDIVKKVARLVKVSEYKRRQAAPGIKLSIKAFQLDRRYPITHFYSG